ncbi:TPA angiotensin converting enzyme precursor-like protein [Leptotrombidium deliense]|uniref:Angiotensin-converting enzyme n=1 Tax=Leptotrombidium deliense TaxID=299467 RepID=A0A443SBN7_9ACAR|nr:TPA angiotensin converting enzyme precursor-like protein [Leptotrombidium deliense]
MSSIYGKAKICVAGKCNLTLEPDITKIMTSERNYDVLKEAWINWRDATGKQMRQMYTEYVQLANYLAISNSFGSIAVFLNYADYWRFPYEDSYFKRNVENLWEEMKAFYADLHAYVRMKLRKIYGDKMPADGTIPAHLLGNMWAQQWGNIYNEVVPYADLPQIDVTSEMIKQGYDAMKMFKLSEKFFVDLGLNKMEDEFWKNSIIVKPENRELICHASAWDFSDGSDFRIKMCTDVNFHDLITIHHEMGHIQYYQLYKDQPQVFREGANPGFHEALGDLMGLSVSTPGHLKKIKLLNNFDESDKGTINFQLKLALDKVAFMPFGYLIDLWRWGVFEGTTTKDQYTRKWWELRINYQGISPPVKRSENDFDPGGKYHVAANSPYMSYFVSHILQFQWHKALCMLAKETILHKCDIDGNKEVGDKIRKVFSQGASIPWQKQLENLTDSAEMSAKPLLEYFTPLREFLKKELAAANEKPGWTASIDDYVERNDTNCGNVSHNSLILLLLVSASLI